MRAGSRKLIDDGHRFSPFYDGVLANHLPMAVSALDRLGASEKEIADFAARYSKILEPLPPPKGAITGRTAADFLGRREAVASWIAYFKTRIFAAGPEAGKPLAGDAGLSWEKIARLAAVAREEHDVKLVYTCCREFDCYGDDAYRLTASAYMSSRAA